ncbi:MAG: hypothetical protein WCC06_01520 [Candidatus Aminicenantales bacterium]
MKKAFPAFFILILCFSLYAAEPDDLLGTITREEILNHCPDWQEVAAAYNPKPEIIDKLRFIPQVIQVEIYLGTWCSDSKAHCSAYFKVLDLMDNPLVQTTYIGIPRDKAARPPYIPEGKNILQLPTFIVWINGEEKGRIIEIPAKSIEEDLLDIISR